MHCLYDAGTLIHDSSTGFAAAPLTLKMKAAMAGGKSLRLWHNRPSHDSLSHKDWHTAGYSDNLEVLALTSHGSIFVGRITSWRDEMYHILPRLPDFSYTLELSMCGHAQRCGLSASTCYDLSCFTGHVLNTALAACGLVRCGYCLMPVDQAVIDLSSSHGVIQAGIAFATDDTTKRLALRPHTW
jgi:hypothetical protein